MGNSVLGLILGILISSATWAQVPGTDFPIKPDAGMTPGSLCQQATSRRYPEHIAYCDRNVATQTKVAVIQAYNQQLGFHIDMSQRANYKIDHYIPLCMGGSNESDNLWPQNQYVFQKTDPIEPLLCQKMAEGKLLQKDAVQLIIKGKNDFSQIQGIINYANSL